MRDKLTKAVVFVMIVIVDSVVPTAVLKLNSVFPFYGTVIYGDKEYLMIIVFPHAYATRCIV